MSRGVRTRRTGPVPSGLARRRQQLLEDFADEAAATDRVGEHVGIIAVVDSVLGQLLKLTGGLFTGHVLGTPVAGVGALHRRRQLLGTNDAKSRGWIGESQLARRQGQGRRGGIAECRYLAIGQRRKRPRQQEFVGGQSPVPFDGQVAAGDLGVAYQPIDDTDRQAVGRNEGRLHCNRFEMGVALCRRIEEHRLSIGP